MDVNDKARDLREHAAKTKLLPEFGNGHRRGGWPDPLMAPYEPTPGQLGFLQSQVAGHRWHVGRCLSGDGDFSAACSCGWGCTETGSAGAILRQVEEHLDAVREICGGRPSTRAPARDERDVGQGELRPDQRARELCAAVEGQQRRLSQALRHSTDLLSASADQADRLVAALEGGKWAKTGASAQSAETVQLKVERARELRRTIFTAAAALAVIAEEVTWNHQDPKTRHPGGPAELQRMVGEVSETAGTARQAGRTSRH